MSLLLTFFAIKCNCRESYEISIFGAPGTDEVENEWIDGFEVLQTGLAMPTRKHIKEAMYTQTIDDGDYPFPGHEVTDEIWLLVRNETAAVQNDFNQKVNLTQEQLYWHPAAAQNYYTTQEALDKVQRVKVKFTVQP